MSAQPVSALHDMLAGMEPKLHKRPFRFVAHGPDDDFIDLLGRMFAFVREEEGVTLVIRTREDQPGPHFACITLQVHSDLEGVGLTAAVATALAALDAGEMLSLAALAARTGYAPHHFHRLFRRITGLTPAAYARGVRAGRAEDALAAGTTVTDAVYAAGYGAPSRFYADVAPRLGMAPRIRAAGGEGVTIRWLRAPTSLGPLLVAATDKGLCRVAFDENEDALARRFPRATLLPGDEALAELATRLVAAVERPGADAVLPLDVGGTAFQERVWQALRAIPAGETRSYAELAAAAGHPRAVRAAGSACAVNPVALAIPCHRAGRSDGGLGGFAWGLERKRALRRREGLE